MTKSQDKGEALRKRVLALFNKTLSFEMKTVPEEGSTKEKIYYLTPNKVSFSKIDVTIEDDQEVFLVIECKNVSKKPVLTDIADRLKRIKKDQNAKAGLIIISGVKISEKEINDIYTSHEIFIWNDELLSYYEKVASTLEKFSFFEIMKSLNIDLEKESQDIFRPALYFKQNINGMILELISFTAYPKDMIKRTFVFRHANKKAGSYQRLVKKKKLKEIADYISAGGSIINSILVMIPEECKFNEVSLDKKEGKWYYGDVKGTLGRINLPQKYCFIELIDGQHRLYSFTKCDEKLRKEFPLNFIAIKGEGEGKESARDLFIVINQKAKKIEANLLASIQEEYDKNHLWTDSESLAREIVRELNRNDSSKLKGKILIGEKVTEKDQELKIYIAMLSYNGLKPLIKEKSILRKLIKKNDLKEYYKILNNYIDRIKTVFPQEYEDTKQYVVFTNNGLIPLFRLFRDICEYYTKISSNDEIDEILKLIKDYSWDTESIKGRSSGAGWKQTYEELITRIQKSNNKFKNFPKK